MGHLLNIISDIYCEKDLLGFEPYIDTLNRMISDKDFKTPFCIGVFGKWGGNVGADALIGQLMQIRPYLAHFALTTCHLL